MSDRCFVDPDRASRCGQAVRRLWSAEDEARNETATRSSTALRERPFCELAFRELCGRGARAASRANALGSASASSRGRESRLWRARDSSVRERVSTYARSANRVLQVRVPGRFVDEPVATTFQGATMRFPVMYSRYKIYFEPCPPACPPAVPTTLLYRTQRHIEPHDTPTRAHSTPLP